MGNKPYKRPRGKLGCTFSFYASSFVPVYPSLTAVSVLRARSDKLQSEAVSVSSWEGWWWQSAGGRRIMHLFPGFLLPPADFLLMASGSSEEPELETWPPALSLRWVLPI